MISSLDWCLKGELVFAKSFLVLVSELAIDGSEDPLPFASMKNTLLLLLNSVV